MGKMQHANWPSILMKTQHLIILTALLGLSALSLHRHRQSHPMTGGDATASCCTLAEKEAPRPTLVVPEDFQAELPPTAAAQWQKPSSLPPMAAFQKWADDFTAQPAAEKIEAGVKAATERRAELRRLIQENPELALASAVPETVRRAMPEEVRALLEQKVDARGDLLVTAVSYSDGKLPEGERAVSTRAKLSDGRKFDAFTYGRREDQPTRLGVPVHGIALDGKLAVSEWPGRVLEPIELKEAKMLAGDGTLCVVSEKPTAAAVTETAVIVERKTQFYCGPSHAAEDLLAASVLETDGDDTQSHQIAASGGEGGTVPGFQPSNPAWTTGTKRMLVVRVSFRLPLPEVGTADYAFLSTTDCEEIVRRIGQSYTVWSYGKYTVAPVQAGGSAVTKAVRLTYQANHYTGDDIYEIWDEVEAALPDLGYDRADYPLLLVLAGNAPFTDPKDATKTVGWGGIGLIGGGKSLIRMNGDGWTNEERLEANHQVSLHEIGHNFGLWHSSNIKPNQVIDPLQPQGAFSTGEEYGDFYDRMGSSSHAFNVRFKQWLGWLPAASVPRATGTGVFTLREHDLEEATGVRGISFPLGDPPINKPRYDLYAEYRLKTLKSLSGVPYVRYEDPLLAYGAVIHVAKLGTAKTWIVDATPETPNDGPLIPGTEDRDWKGNFDAPLLPGRTMSFTRDDLTTYVTNLSADPEAGQLRLEVRHGSDEEIKAPVGQITKSSVTIAQGEKITLTADATDADDTDLAYFWQIPRFDYSNMQPAVFANSRDISVQFPQLGVYDVSCIVSDKHGGTVKLLTSFMVTENSAPTISAIGTHSMDEDTTLTVPFTVGDVSTPASSLTVAYSYTASDPLLFNFLSFQFTGTVANRHGSATIRVKVSDGGKTTTEEFDLIVNPTTPGTTLLASGSTGWHYRASSLPPVGDWKSSTYDDSTWTVSNARFSYPGPFGNFGGWTILPNVAGRVTCFFRKTFTMPALPNGAAMIRLLCDDGAVVYVNGTEVYRHNMPSGIIYPTTPALTSVEGFLENVRTVIPVNPSLLINGGTNLIAVEVHDSNGVRNGSSGDVEFDLEFGLSLAPVVNTISDQTVLEDTAAGPYEFTASDFEAGGGPLNFRISSSDQSIIHETHAFVSATGTPGHYSLFMTPEPNATGSTQITLKVSDGQTETWRTFNLHVMPVNDAPSMDVIDSLGRV